MHDNKFVISISGHGECGKDTAAAFFHKYLFLPYKQSTSYCVVDPWWEEIVAGRFSAEVNPGSKPQGCENIVIESNDYKSKEDFYADRRNRRMDWVAYISQFNWSYGGQGVGLYARAVETGNQILTGIRRTGEFERCLEHIIDVSIWINRGVPLDESQEYGPELCDYIIDNNGTIEDLDGQCRALSAVILKEMRNASYTVQWIDQAISLI